MEVLGFSYVLNSDGSKSALIELLVGGVARLYRWDVSAGITLTREAISQAFDDGLLVLD